MKAVAFVIAMIAAQSAFAADLPSPPGPAPMDYHPPSEFNWGGLYLGINGGYGIGSTSWTGNGVSTGSFRDSGPLTGGTIGLNWQLGDALVFGAEVDGDWAFFKGNSSNAYCSSITAGATCETKSTLLVTARGRLGYAIHGLLVYGTAGGAWGDIQTGLNPPATLDTTYNLGWTAGGGLEYEIANNWTAKIEYLYVDLGVASCQSANCGTGVPVNVPLTENVIRAGLNFRFAPW